MRGIIMSTNNYQATIKYENRNVDLGAYPYPEQAEWAKWYGECLLNNDISKMPDITLEEIKFIKPRVVNAASNTLRRRQLWLLAARMRAISFT